MNTTQLFWDKICPIHVITIMEMVEMVNMASLQWLGLKSKTRGNRIEKSFNHTVGPQSLTTLVQQPLRRRLVWVCLP